MIYKEIEGLLEISSKPCFISNKLRSEILWDKMDFMPSSEPSAAFSVTPLGILRFLLPHIELVNIKCRLIKTIGR
jgi:hypothetical protein